MDDLQRETLNDFFVNTFNKIMTLEERTIARGNIGKVSVKEMHIIEAVSILRKKNKNTMTEIAQVVGITVGALTTAVNTLIKKEYLMKRRSDVDRRVVFISLTEKGMRAEMHHRIFHENMISDVGNVLGEKELSSLIDALKQLSDYFSDHLKEKKC